MARKREARPAWSLADARADNFSLPGRSRRITVQPAEMPEPIETPEPVEEPIEPGGEPIPADPPPPEEPYEEPIEPEPVKPAPEREPEKIPA